MAEKQQTRNLCAQIPIDLHARVREEQERSGKTLGEYMTILIQEYYERKEGATMSGETRTFAAQIPAELFDELDRYLAERRIKKKDFLIDCIRRTLDAAKAENAAETAETTEIMETTETAE